MQEIFSMGNENYRTNIKRVSASEDDFFYQIGVQMEIQSSDGENVGYAQTKFVRDKEAEPGKDWQAWHAHFDLASKLSGSRFVVLKGILAKLERVIAQFMLDKHTNENGYTEMNVPFLVKEDTLFGTGNLPKFGEDLFTAGDHHWLIPTAEVPLTNLSNNQILNINECNMQIHIYEIKS